MLVEFFWSASTLGGRTDTLRRHTAGSVDKGPTVDNILDEHVFERLA